MELETNQKDYKFIVFSTIVILSIGLLNVLLPFFVIDIYAMDIPQGSVMRTSIEILGRFRPIHLNIGPLMSNFHIWDILFLCVMLLGLIRFVQHRGKDSSLLGFVYAVMFLVSALSILVRMFWLFVVSAQVQGIDKGVMFYFYAVLGLFVLVVYCWVSYRILSSLRAAKSLDVLDVGGELYYRDSGKGLRFWHLVIDSLLIILIFMPFVVWVFSWYKDKPFVQEYMNDKSFLVIMLIGFRFLYYMSFEAIFGATPAKFLTNSRVIGEDNAPLGIGKVLGRTLSREIPFEPFSFWSGEGWHDGLPRTSVVKEKEEVSPINYTWLLLFVVISIVIYYVYFDNYYHVAIP